MRTDDCSQTILEFKFSLTNQELAEYALAERGYSNLTHDCHEGHKTMDFAKKPMLRWSSNTTQYFCSRKLPILDPHKMMSKRLCSRLCLVFGRKLLLVIFGLVRELSRWGSFICMFSNQTLSKSRYFSVNQIKLILQTSRKLQWSYNWKNCRLFYFSQNQRLWQNEFGGANQKAPMSFKVSNDDLIFLEFEEAAIQILRHSFRHTSTQFLTHMTVLVA